VERIWIIPNCIKKPKPTVFTAFEIFEHLLNPYTILENVNCSKLISVPLRLWFSPAYRSKTDMWDRHYHEFEDWQLDWLLKKQVGKLSSENSLIRLKLDSDLYYGLHKILYSIC
jgi:hypothetical protein